jgi:hypothetical protein
MYIIPPQFTPYTPSKAENTVYLVQNFLKRKKLGLDPQGPRNKTWPSAISGHPSPSDPSIAPTL